MNIRIIPLALLLALGVGGTLSGQNTNCLELNLQESPKFTSSHANPLVDFAFVADPTAVEYNGRLYVYGTYDSQQLDSVGLQGRNTYEHTHSLAMLSTDDMVNWTWHGIIDVAALSPWGIASWAPSITSRVEADGKTHFYLYYSNSGAGVGVLTSTSPVGPWTDPLGRALICHTTQGLGDCEAPFDPGVLIDPDGTGWLTFGGGDPNKSRGTDRRPGNTRIVRLGRDMISLDSDIIELDAPYHFEANELNYVGGTYVYTYNTNWKNRDEWEFTDVEKPTRCCMSYMTSHTPLDSASWVYRGNYFRNPADYGMDPSNNHTHLHKYCGDWYLFYHNLCLQRYKGTQGGFRSLCVNKVQVNEQTPTYRMTEATLEGVPQIKPVNPFIRQQAETTAATVGIRFLPAGDRPGNMTASVHPSEPHAATLVRAVYFSHAPNRFEARAAGRGTIQVYVGRPQGKPVATLTFDSNDMETRSTSPATIRTGCHDLCFVLTGEGLRVDEWRFLD